MSPILAGVLGSLAAGLATAVGALPALVLRRVGERVQVALLGGAAGVMLAASFFSLILPGLEAARAGGSGDVAAALVMTGGIVLGAGGIALLDHFSPHEHFIKGAEGPRREGLRRIWLFVIAITIHNAPEGLAVGVAFGDSVAAGRTVALGIGLQNMPEGLAVAVALANHGYRRRDAFGIALLTGLVEPAAGLIGAAAVAAGRFMLPWSMAFAAGAMLYVISHEIIPETHRGRSARTATAGLIAGFVIMMFLDITFG